MKKIEEFDPEELPKEGGATAGFVKVISSGSAKGKYMLKPIPLEDIGSDVDKDIDRCCALTEYCFGGVFKKILNDQAPDIGLVQGQDQRLFLSSKFLENFFHIDKFLEVHKGDQTSSPTVIGMEKIVVTSILCGDTDLNQGNVGIVTRTSDGKEQYLAVKIDHGAAGSLDLKEDFSLSINKFYLEKYKYPQFLQFDLGETRKAVAEVLAACPEGSITEAVSNLTKLKVNPEYMDVISFDTKSIKDFEEYLNARKNMLQEFGKKLDLVELIDHPDPKWKKTVAWIEAASDPVSWRANNEQVLSKKVLGQEVPVEDMIISAAKLSKEDFTQISAIGSELKKHIISEESPKPSLIPKPAKGKSNALSNKPSFSRGI